jgi:tRNA(Glu) U13 pseudouridine synthase TruD
MTLTFNEIFAKRVAVRARINEAIQADDEENLQRFVKAAQAGNIPLSDTKEAVRVINGVLRDHGGPVKTKKKGATTMSTSGATTKYTDKQQVLEEANRLAKELMAKDPSLSLAAARAKVWEQNPDLAQAYRDLPKGPEVKVAGAVRKGDSSLREVREKAQELRKADPELSPVQARMRVWETHPELAEEYEREIR